MLHGQFEAPTSQEDAFVAKKRKEREAEKAALTGSCSGFTSQLDKEGRSKNNPNFASDKRQKN